MTKKVSEPDSYYDDTSDSYIGLHGEEQMAKATVIQAELRPKPGQLLLDVGCGPAHYFPIFGCRCIGIDPSIGLLKVGESLAEDGSGLIVDADSARAALDEEGGNMLIHGSAEDLPFDDDSFDYVISITAIQNFSSIPKGLDEMARVGRGLFAISVLKSSSKLDLIDKEIKKRFSIAKIVLSDKDIIYFLVKNIK